MESENGEKRNTEMSSERQNDLVRIMVREGYTKEFASLIADELKTDFTCERMINYIRRSGYLPMEEVADEMLSVIAERDAIVAKKSLESNQAAINRVIRYGFDTDDEE